MDESIREFDVVGPNGGTLHAYVQDGAGDAVAVCWHHGTPNIGTPPAPLYPTATELGLRWFSYDRPGYGGSTRRSGRTVGAAAADAAAVADALGIGRFAAFGHSGGGPYALACAARLGDRVAATVAVSGPAPFGAAGLDWFAGMAAAGVASNQAAAKGRTSREAYELEQDPEADFGFTDGDEAALGGRWSWFLDVVRPALAQGPDGAIDDDLAAVAPWGFDPTAIATPVLLLHGSADRVVPPAHGRWLAAHMSTAELRIGAGDGHITVLDSAPAGLRWIAERA